MRSEDEPTVRLVIYGEHRDECHAAMQKEVFKLEEMRCCNVVSRAKDTRIHHTKFVLKGKRDAAGEAK